ncbi:FtsX-like permease family protein [Psychrobacillus sp. NPDC096623]|uniref:FtsX-like permease family protein n=1 Tax=Psychrobacillus sp. NPDC096623 TaxID=3364492 RepID=UPI00380A81D7
MTLSQLVFRSMKKNIRHYYLYFFALIFSVSLYFSFVTLQYNPSVLEISKGVKASAGLKSASFILLFVVVFFVLYANHLFMKRRSKEIGLYQLIGMSKGLVTRLLALENTILWISAIGVGVGIGFLTSRLFAMILLRILEEEASVDLIFSVNALQMTIIVFVALLFVVLIQTMIHIRRVTLLTLFTATAIADTKIKRFSAPQMVLGLFGLLLISYGYYSSTKLFDVENASVRALFTRMLIILTSTIIGTYFVFRFSVSFVLNLIRKQKRGHLSIVDVLSLSPIMHRMKSNAMSLTTITIISATALGILCLSYISYYSAGSVAKQNIPFDYVIPNNSGDAFIAALEDKNIRHTHTAIELLDLEVDTGELFASKIPDGITVMTKGLMPVAKLSDAQQVMPGLELEEDEGYVVGYSNVMAELIKLEANNPVQMTTSNEKLEVTIKEIMGDSLLAYFLSGGGMTIVVNDELFEKLSEDKLIQQQTVWNKQVGIDLEDRSRLSEVQSIYDETTNDGMLELMINNGERRIVKLESQETYRQDTLEMMGLVIFVTGFLGLAFLITTGSILYFKQMSEADEERSSYTNLRKIGFTTNELMKGIYMKQLFNFGVPLIIGLAHSYFAVKSGWMFFGTELLAPLLITMGVYVVLYSTFAFLSIGYYRKVVNNSL